MRRTMLVKKKKAWGNMTKMTKQKEKEKRRRRRVERCTGKNNVLGDVVGDDIVALAPVDGCGVG